MEKNSKIFWCTGMSGVGKSTLTDYAIIELEKRGFSTLILDGDAVRDNYNVKLGFGRKDVEKNNLNVSRICVEERCNYDAIIVPIISPIDSVRRIIKEHLSPDFYLIYVFADINSLKERDPKGLYKKADHNEITDLIGYSESNPYDIPENYDIMIDTSKKSEIMNTKERLTKFFLEKMS